MTKYRVGVDIGGTFTDIVFLGEYGERLTKKVSSTVDNYATAIVDGLAELTGEHNLAPARSSSYCMGPRSPRMRSSN
jgi:N-methylhydantoinase A